jgi:hypothetical protein
MKKSFKKLQPLTINQPLKWSSDGESKEALKLFLRQYQKKDSKKTLTFLTSIYHNQKWRPLIHSIKIKDIMTLEFFANLDSKHSIQFLSEKTIFITAKICNIKHII